MKIHELSKQSGIHLETIRYYEKMGLMPEPKRLANGYRDYDEASLKQLKFIKTCRALDFSLAEIKFFNEMKTQKSQHCEVDSMLAKHLVSVEEKIAELTEIKHFLQSLITEDEHQAADCKAMAQLKAY
ncbi:MAG: MerR family transcriptional regulator [Haemophilus parainfluenzae]|jgi:raw score 10.33|uniref:MerR family transcriptional regulator n=1 Tax=Haemophilus parainfluenzae TaxID=729 RepID=A0AB37IWM6_HAEPA|nr:MULTISPECIES: MerR family transcriptional regulator [Haemophilus]MDU4565849.1 MerR family transcriptional regulator [Haemophilus parainfluenzae]MDU4637629.1 MerR family transcriptional regulator [Haemophilus parainfluenzae]MDU5009276.1 MerR family transcriptional regulator [Haemophilus parainfluenzae]MDU5990157.1 MerR family transcriptional regulator [Haemophilus parainfluenzae]MDU7968842.1 MerR family transcriptional regulator [Haemophilus parainfluenzae]